MTGGGYGGTNPGNMQYVMVPSAYGMIPQLTPMPGPESVATGSPAASSYPQSAQGGYQGQFSVPQSPSVAAPSQTLTPIEQLQQQLQQQLASLNISNFLTPESVINQEANGAVNSQYDPQISGLLNQISTTKSTTKDNQNQATQMYDALAQNLSDQIPAMQQQEKSQQAAANTLYSGSKNDIQQNYQQQSQNQQNTLAQLGLQAATGTGSSGNPAVTANTPVGGVGQQAAANEAYATSQADLQNQQAQNQLAEQGASQNQYQSSMADNSKMAGANTVEDLAKQLSTYLSGANSQVSSLQSSKAQALSSMLAQLEQQNQTNAQSQYQSAFNNTMATNNFGLSALKESDSNTQASNTLAQQLALAEQKNNAAPTTGPTGAAAYLAQQYQSNPQEAIKLNQLVQDTMGRPDVLNGVHNVNGTQTSDTQAYLIDQLRQQAATEGVTNQTDLNNAINAFLAFTGKLK